MFVHKTKYEILRVSFYALILNTLKLLIVLAIIIVQEIIVSFN